MACRFRAAFPRDPRLFPPYTGRGMDDQCVSVCVWQLQREPPAFASDDRPHDCHQLVDFSSGCVRDRPLPITRQEFHSFRPQFIALYAGRSHGCQPSNRVCLSVSHPADDDWVDCRLRRRYFPIDARTDHRRAA
jgi:hypothetical protein